MTTAAAKRGHGNVPLSRDEVERALALEPAFGDATMTALLALDRALQQLGEASERQRRVVECRFFADPPRRTVGCDIALPYEQRLAFLAQLDVDDEIRHELESLLAHAERAQTFFSLIGDVMPDVVSAASLEDVAADSAADVAVGSIVSRYRFDERLGAGGMGVVYRAHDTGAPRSIGRGWRHGCGTPIRQCDVSGAVRRFGAASS